MTERLRAGDHARSARAHVASIEAILEVHPACREALRVNRRRYSTPLIPGALQVLEGIDRSTWLEASQRWHAASSHWWAMVADLPPRRIFSATRRLHAPNMTRGDIHQEALLGAYNGAMRWDPEGSGKWERWGLEWGYARAQRAVMVHARLIRVPRQQRRGLYILCLDAPLPGLEDETLLDVIPSHDDAADSITEEGQMMRALLACCRTDRELQIMTLRFSRAASRMEVGRAVGLSRERVRAIEVEVLDRLRRSVP